MKRVLGIFFLLTIFSAMTVDVYAAPNFSGQYQAWVMGTTVTANVNHNGNKVNGVAWYHDFWGKKHTFHFYGSYNNGLVQARHNSGHYFNGRATGDGRVVGVITTNSGLRIPINASRR